MRILITGGTGFVGEPIVKKLLSQGHKLLILTRQNAIKEIGIDYIKGDLSHISSSMECEICDWKPELCVHSAWEGIPDYNWDTSLKNLQYTLNLLNICHLANIKTFLTMGSCWEYKNLVGKISEDEMLTGENGYKSVKNSLRFMIEAFCNEHEMSFYWLRLFYVYGPQQKQNSLLPSILSDLKAGIIPQVKTPQNSHDFIHVDDVAEAVSSFIECAPKSGSYNLGTGVAVSVGKIVEIASKILGVTINCADNNNGLPILSFYADMTKTYEAVSWRNTIFIDDGVKFLLQGLEDV